MKRSLQWELSFPIFSGPNLYDGNSFTSWYQDFSITNNCSIQALLSTSSRQPIRPRELVSRQLLKPLHGERCLSSNPQSTFPTLGVSSGCPEKWSFPINTISTSPGMPRGSDHPPSIISSQPREELSDCLVSTVPPALIHWGRAEEGQLEELTL